MMRRRSRVIISGLESRTCQRSADKKANTSRVFAKNSPLCFCQRRSAVRWGHQVFQRGFTQSCGERESGEGITSVLFFEAVRVDMNPTDFLFWLETKARWGERMAAVGTFYIFIHFIFNSQLNSIRPSQQKRSTAFFFLDS